MKSLGIFIGKYMINVPGIRHWDENTVQQGMGGSETWVYEVAMRLPDYGYEVTVYADPETDHDPKQGFHLISHERFWYDMLHKEYDYFIFSRFSSIDHITPYLKCHNVYTMVHDICIVTPDHLQSQIGLGRIKKYCYLSDWHKDYLLQLYGGIGMTPDMLYKVSNGYSEQYYQNIDFNKKTNSMIWSSSLARGFADFYEFVFQPILKEIPDFKLYVCTGTIAPADDIMLKKAHLLPGVEVLTKLPKDELAKYQRESKIWIYPGVFPETFCITAVENANAGNVIISPLSYGLSTTLSNINYLKEWNLPILDEETAPKFVDIAIKVLKDDDYRLKLANECIDACKEYSWDRAANEIVSLLQNDNMTAHKLYNRFLQINKINNPE